MQTDVHILCIDRLQEKDWRTITIYLNHLSISIIYYVISLSQYLSLYISLSIYVSLYMYIYIYLLKICYLSI